MKVKKAKRHNEEWPVEEHKYFLNYMADNTPRISGTTTNLNWLLEKTNHLPNSKRTEIFQHIQENNPNLKNNGDATYALKQAESALGPIQPPIYNPNN